MFRERENVGWRFSMDCSDVTNEFDQTRRFIYATEFSFFPSFFFLFFF